MRHYLAYRLITASSALGVDVLVVVTLSTLIFSFACALAFVGYRSMGGTFEEALSAGRRVVAHASLFAERLGSSSGAMVLRIRTPQISTYRDAHWLLVVEAPGVDVSPKSVVVPAGTSVNLELQVGSAADLTRVEVGIFDVDTMKAVGRISASVPPAKKAGWIRRLIATAEGGRS